MTKNRTMRVAVLMLALTLITSCFVGGTFAKYTTSGTADDTARVAKWGVSVFTIADNSAFAKEYLDSDTKTNVVVKSEDFVVAPGTSSDEVEGNLVFGVTGTPEVATQITVKFEGKDIYYGTYHPIVFTLSVMDNNDPIADPANVDWTDATVIKTGTLAEIVTAVNEYANGLTTEAGEDIDALYKIDWAWGFNQDDTNDTNLGDLAATAPGEGNIDGTAYNTVLNYGVEVTVEQVD